jgi:tetratricopeptide (TPR) repeat protein
LLYDLGECYLYTGNYEEAEQVLERVQELAIVRRDNPLLVLVYKNLGLLEYERKRYHMALFRWQKALEEANHLEHVDPYLKGTILFNLALVHTKLGTLQEAVAYYEQAVSMYQGTNHMEALGKLYMGLAQSYQRMGYLQISSQYAEKAAVTFEILDDLYMQTKLKLSQGVLLAQTGSFEESVKRLEEAIVQFEEMQKFEDVGVAYVERAKVHLQLGETALAELSCQQARTLLPELHPYQAWVHRLMARLALQKGCIEEAAKLLRRAADGFKQTGDFGEFDGTLTELSQLYSEQGDYQEAYRVCFEKSLYTKNVLQQRGIVL